MLTIWGRTNSINVQKVLWCCEELALPYRRIDAGGPFGVSDTAQYLIRNPNGLVPLIEDDGFFLWESNVIVRYLAGRHGAGTLYPIDAQARYAGEQWMDWQAATLWPALRPVFLALVRTPAAQRDRAALQPLEAEGARLMAMLDHRLADRAYVGGDAFSMADIPAGAAAYRWFALDMARPDLPHLRRWYDLLAAREPYRRSVMLPLS